VATSAFQRLLRVLELEERQGWRNRAVIGGLQAMAARWQNDAEAEAADAAVVQAVVALMGRYDAATPQARPDLAAAIRQTLAGEAVDLPEAASAEEPAPTEAGSTVVETVAALPLPEPTHLARERVRRQQRGARDLEAPPSVLPGVGSATEEQLARLGVHQVQDLLWHLPARHDDYSRLMTIAQMQPGDQVTVIANLWDVKERKLSATRVMIQGVLADGTGTLHATWWNKYVRNQLKVGSTMRFSGKVGLYLGHKTLENPVFEDVDEEMVATGRMAPVYPLTEGISNKKLRGLVKTVLDDYAPLLPDPLPASLSREVGLPSLVQALRQVHFPDSTEQLEAGLRRLAFDEFLYIQLGVLQRRQSLRAASAQPLASDDTLIERFRRGLPFALTGAQARVLDEILRDVARSVPMTRMVQGDVGSGKTALAAAGMFVAAANGAQSAMLAPTQILAEQHYRSLERLLDGQTRPDGTPLRLALLTGRVTGAARAAILEEMSRGETDIMVGTTALIQEAVEFNNLAFVVVDEQHRFGVEQRGALRSKGEQPHLLVMSATPIPRSLALTIYGDLDVSVIDEMPPGRTPVKTKWFRPRERERLYGFLRREVQQGRQAFVVYPLVEESEKLEAGAAVDAWERLSKQVFPDLRLGLLHGRMSGQDKDLIMRGFAERDFDVLVSTSVIEVGIDVPNASLMIIEDAERFGLAQLHQLRGRVGRGEHKSYCALVSKATGPEAEERLRVLESTTSGFTLAEKDLELRGPGDFLGTRQSGLPELRVAQLSDMTTLAAAREAAQRIFAQSPTLADYPLLAQQVERFWRGQGDVS
jgi:ATP-dependent DNA helicase RecG